MLDGKNCYLCLEPFLLPMSWNRICDPDVLPMHILLILVKILIFIKLSV